MALPPSVRSRVEAGENIGAVVSPLLRDEARRSTVAYRLSAANVAGPRTREAILGAGTFGEVSLQSFAPTAPPVAGVAVPGATVAVKKSLNADDIESIISEVACLRYLQGVPHVAQLVGVTSRPAEGNAPVPLPLVMMAPAKSSLASLTTGPRRGLTDAATFTAEQTLRSAWGNDFPYTLNSGAYVPAWVDLYPDRDARRASATAKAHDPTNATRPLLRRSWSKIKDICRQVLLGYANLHSLGIVHRDTKPGNILVTAYGEVQITDFGMSKYLTPGLPTPKDFYTGTYWYASPELLMKHTLLHMGQPVVPPTRGEWKAHDAWAVGTVLYNILTRAPVFWGTTPIEVLRRIFLVKGTPTSTAEDGSLYSGLQRASALHINFGDYAKNPDAIIDRIMSNAIVISPDFDPANPKTNLSELRDIARIINGLLHYDPARRLSVEDALTISPFLSPPAPLPRPLISFPFSFNSVDNAALGIADFSLNQTHAPILDSYTMGVVCTKASYRTAPFVADRACLYFRAFTRYYSTEGREKLLAREPAGVHFLAIQNFSFHCEISAMIASCLMQSGAHNSLETIRDASPGHPFLPMLPTVLSLYLEGKIAFLGRTYFDDLIAGDPRLVGVIEGSIEYENRIRALGILNLFCYGSAYNDFADNLHLLYQVIYRYADRERVELGKYFLSKIAFYTDGDYTAVLDQFERVLTTFDGAVEFEYAPLVTYLAGKGKRPSAGVVGLAAAGYLPADIVAIINSLPAVPAPLPAAPLPAAPLPPSPPGPAPWPPTPPLHNAVGNAPHVAVNIAPAPAVAPADSNAPPNGFVNVPLGRRGRRLSRRGKQTARRRRAWARKQSRRK